MSKHRFEVSDNGCLAIVFIGVVLYWIVDLIVEMIVKLNC